MRLMENPPKIWDAVRRRWLVLTPEEWVRQHLIRLLVERGGVPPGNISQEYPVALSGAAQEWTRTTSDWQDEYMLQLLNPQKWG